MPLYVYVCECVIERANMRRFFSHRHGVTRDGRACLCALTADAVHDSPSRYL